MNVSVRAHATTIRTDRCAPGLVETVIETPNSYEIDFRIDSVRLLASLKHVDTDQVAIQCEDSAGPACIRHGGCLAVIALMRDPRPEPLYVY